ncbi:hypothetical protein LCGC14_2196360 [marine sediment metagenome]|uniref:Uncharacterized protein n=1 Tax=marine sediment metagenome TaxID=412755 RepID=A0A0F9DI76_9ZZZZ
MNQPSTTLKSLRDEHQEKARRAAASGTIPPEFLGDPAFKELVAQQKNELARNES